MSRRPVIEGLAVLSYADSVTLKEFGVVPGSWQSMLLSSTATGITPHHDFM